MWEEQVSQVGRSGGRTAGGVTEPTPPAVSLPKGGAIRSIVEKFAPNPPTGTGSLTVPIDSSQGRSGFGPQLSSSYDPGAGNHPSASPEPSLSTITRKTRGCRSIGMPKRRTYTSSFPEDLVLVLRSDETRFRNDQSAPGYAIYRHRPRTETPFVRKEPTQGADMVGGMFYLLYFRAGVAIFTHRRTKLLRPICIRHSWVSFATLLCAVLLLAACGGPPNHLPSADAGQDQRVPIGTLVQLSGAGVDEDEDMLSYQWQFLAKPSASSASLSDAAAANPTFTADAEGEFTLQLIVSDGHAESDPDTVTITAFANTPPEADAGPNRDVGVGMDVQLDGEKSTDAEGQPLTYQWSFVSKPEASAATIENAMSSRARFIPDVVGRYVVSLSVDDGLDASEDTVAITAVVDRPTLDHGFLDAEYSEQLSRLVMVDASPDRLYLYDPVSEAEESVDLSVPPTSVSVGPDGLYAAVGHDARVTYVDLANAEVVAIHEVQVEVLDIVLAGNGFAYLFPTRDQWTDLWALDLSTGEEFQGTATIYAGTVGRLHPSGKYIYGANNGLSPDDLEKYDIQGGVATMLYDSPYHGDYPMCGDLWVSREGARIFTKCGYVFRASESQAQDMTYNGHLQNVEFIGSLTHLESRGEVALIQENRWWEEESVFDTEVQVFRYDGLTYLRSIDLPHVLVEDRAFTYHGRFLAFDAELGQLVVLMQADPEAGLSNDTGVITYDVSNP